MYVAILFWSVFCFSFDLSHGDFFPLGIIIFFFNYVVEFYHTLISLLLVFLGWV